MSLILKRNLLPRDASNDNVGRVLRDHLVVVQHLEFFGRLSSKVSVMSHHLLLVAYQYSHPSPYAKTAPAAHQGARPPNPSHSSRSP